VLLIDVMERKSSWMKMGHALRTKDENNGRFKSMEATMLANTFGAFKGDRSVVASPPQTA